MKKIDVIILDENGPQFKTIEDSLESFYKEIKCEGFEGYSGTEIGQKYGLDIYIDEWGKTRQNVITGLFLRNGEVIDFLAGNVLICRHDQHGDSTSVNFADLAKLGYHLFPSDWYEMSQEASSRWKFAKKLLILEC